jgi:hypothetical protein
MARRKLEWLWFWMVVLFSFTGCNSEVGALEVKWTPQSDEGPLPLSKNYRDKLKLLEEKA